MMNLNFNRRLTLESVLRQPDGGGGFGEVWTALGQLWGDIRALSGREKPTRAGSVALVPYRIIVRAAPVDAVSRPVAGQRFVEGTRVFRVTAVSDYDPMGLYLECFCKEELST